MVDRKIATLVSWNLIKRDNQYFASNTHIIYIEYLSLHFEVVYLITPVIVSDQTKLFENLNSFRNIVVVELPYSSSYLAAQKYFFVYLNKIKQTLKFTNNIYCRVPDPFCWIPQLCFRANTIMHFVGDTIDASRKNERWSLFKKIIMITGYLPNYWLTLLAAGRSKVYTNGSHLFYKLKKYRIDAFPVVSSIIKKSDIGNKVSHNKDQFSRVRLIYIGYLRHAKGIDCLMKLWKKLDDNNIDFIFDVIGDGELFDEIKLFIKLKKLEEKVLIHGMIDSRIKINELLDSSDIFIFPSLSEGSPRVVLEAMARSVLVISTPVGSLPTAFDNNSEIIFVDFNDVDGFYEAIKKYIRNRADYNQIVNNAFEKVINNYTADIFFEKIFTFKV